MDTPIVNHPQVAILGTGAIVKRPAVISVDGADAIAVRQIAFHSLSYDHRWIDGHRATIFNVRVKQILEAGEFAAELGLEPES
jgi:2-oxoglutarate dehydrogenase E2 component (dihydrolipoamide succinyltransferase)